MKQLKGIFCVATLATSSILAFAGAVTPIKEKGKVVIFDANKNEIKDINNYTAKWGKGSDLTPTAKLVANENGKWAKISITGAKGSAISRIDVEKGILETLRAEGQVYDGLKLKINYDGQEFEKLQVQAFFKDKSMLVKYISLEKGIKEYSLKKGFRRSKLPPDWDNLKFVWLSTNKPGMTFMLQKITMAEKKSEKKAKTLKITGQKKIKEIFPSQAPVLSGGKINPDCFKNAAELKNFYTYREKEPLKESPFAARICYDEDHIAIQTTAEFPMPPQANVKTQDDGVYQDEAVEFFFSPWLDNNKKVQFVLNAAGTTFDYIRDYDKVAARIVNITQWNLPHKKELKYKENIWKTNIAFPLKDLKINLSENRLSGFQLAQSYRVGKHGADKFNTLCWAPTSKFPSADRFGILVFNIKKFGQGEAKIKEIKSFEKNKKLIDLTINFSIKKFKPGSYRLQKILTAADSTIYKQEEKLAIKENDCELSAKLTSIKNINGIYTVCLSFYNDNNDIKATAVNFENSTPLKDMFGKTIFCPTPKKVEWGKEMLNMSDYKRILIPETATERTLKTAKIFSKDLLGFTASENEIKKTSKATEKSIELKIAKTAKFKGKETALKKEGYCLEISPKKITLTGADEPGLYYGCVTLLQIIKMPMKFGAPIKSASILDWPDVEHRMMRLPHPWQFKNRKFKEIRSIDFLKDWAERFVAGNKYNRFYLDVSHLVKFKRRPEFCGTERIFSLKDIRSLAEFCRDRFVEIIPAFQVGGHANWWLLGYHPELREKGYKNMSDYTHPEHNKIVFGCMLDMIEATNAKYVTPKSDENWHAKHPDEMPDEKLRGKTRAQAFLDFHVELNNLLKKHGTKMLIYEDMVNPRHNGKRYDVYKVIDKLPKDIIIAQWGGTSPDLTANYFIDKGFEVWGTSTGFWTYGKMAKNRVKGFGVSAYGYGTDWKLFRQSLGFSANEQFMGADAAWNLKRDGHPELVDEVASGKLVALREMYALQPNSQASEKIVPIGIQKSMNDSFLKVIQKDTPEAEIVNMPTGESNIGNIPTLLSKTSDNCIFLPKGSSVEFSVGKKFSSLIFLHTGYISPKAVKNFKGNHRNWIYGYPVGDYNVVYSDGSSEKLPIRLKWEINWMNESPLFRTTVNNRYILPVKLSDKNYRFIYQWEWVNPHPEKEIEKVSYKHDNHFDFNLLLFAISGREAKAKK